MRLDVFRVVCTRGVVGVAFATCARHVRAPESGVLLYGGVVVALAVLALVTQTLRSRAVDQLDAESTTALRSST